MFSLKLNSESESQKKVEIRSKLDAFVRSRRHILTRMREYESEEA